MTLQAGRHDAYYASQLRWASSRHVPNKGRRAAAGLRSHLFCRQSSVLTCFSQHQPFEPCSAGMAALLAAAAAGLAGTHPPLSCCCAASAAQVPPSLASARCCEVVELSQNPQLELCRADVEAALLPMPRLGLLLVGKWPGCTAALDWRTGGWAGSACYQGGMLLFLGHAASAGGELVALSSHVMKVLLAARPVPCVAGQAAHFTACWQLRSS